MTALVQVAPPRLPVAPQQYDTRFHDLHSDVLRLYFAQLSNNVNTLTGTRGGQYVNNPYAAVQRTTDKTFTANTATQITFNQNDYLNGCENDGTDGITVRQSGIYNYQFSVQFANTDSQIHTAWIWLRKNNVDVPGTASKFDVPNRHGSSDGYLIAACNFFIDLNSGDYVSMYAAVSQAYVPTVSAGIYMEAYPAQTTPFAHPAIPSVVATLTFVSSILP